MAVITELPIFNMLRSRMAWHQERQRVLAENVANADTPNFRPKDLAPLRFDRPAIAGVALQRTDAGHVTASVASGSAFRAAAMASQEVRPSGNAVSLEDEMLKVATNQMDYQAVTTLYSRSLALIKTAVGRR